MKFPYSMLLDFVDTKLTAEEVGDLLTMAGFELEGIEDVEGDQVLDIKVVSNRGDGLSVFGLAREVLAKDATANPQPLYTAAANRFEKDSTESKIQIADDTAQIQSADCNRFACRVFANVPSASTSPDWMQRRLRQAGMRPISLLVDLTNYVMLELGQPLHAFDRDKLRGGRIIVRDAAPADRLTTLNGAEHELQGQMMICDAERPVGVPGVMGGLETEVSDETKNVLLESANFVNTTVRRTRKQLGLATEASYRFERSVDPDGVVAAIRRFSQLLQDAAPGVELSNIVDHYPRRPNATAITVRPDRASKLLGMPITASQANQHLSRLGMSVEPSGDALMVTPPSWRPDIVREEDLIEEIGRVHGYERIPEVLPQGTTPVGGPHGFELWLDKLRESAVRAGLIQAISHSLRDLHPLDDPLLERIGPRTPASPDTAYLRSSLLPSLADAARRNGAKEVHVFEIGKVFGRRNSDYSEEYRLAILSLGAQQPASWQGESGAATFFSLKGAVESMLLEAGVQARFALPNETDSRLHPTRQSMLWVGDVPLGELGQIHPDVAEQCGLPPETYLCEIGLGAAFQGRSTTLDLHPVSRFPSVRRDISIQIEEAVPFEKIEQAVASSAGDLLEKQWLFDVYSGKGIPEGSHSLAIALQLRKQDGTFTDEEANQVRDRAVEALASLGAIRR